MSKYRGGLKPYTEGLLVPIVLLDISLNLRKPKTPDQE